MNHKIKRKWVAALRSGQWKQCRGSFFADGNRRCALGVLTEVVSPFYYQGGRNYATSRRYNLNLFLTRDTQDAIANMNDSRGASFNQIADWIEAHL